MWTTIRVFFSGALKKVLSTLIPWLKTEAAKFLADVFDDAKDIVAEVSLKSELTNREKFDLAQRMLRDAAKQKGVMYKTRWLNNAVETAYNAFREELEADVEDNK